MKYLEGTTWKSLRTLHIFEKCFIIWKAFWKTCRNYLSAMLHAVRSCKNL